MKQFTEATAFVLFGGTGDLSKKKLLPGLFNLYCKGVLPDEFRIIGVARDEYSEESYRDMVSDIVSPGATGREEKLQNFLAQVHYVSGYFDEEEAYENLTRELEEACGSYNRLFYLAVSPKFHEVIFSHLAKSQLTHESDGTWRRVLIEKPFGTDLATDRALDRMIASYFDESQIFRIDHYLAKEALQNILFFRFSNVLLENSWSNAFIEKIHIRLYEDIGIEERSAFYDAVGALRDVGQNHLLQMLAVTTMDNPGKLSSHTIREERLNILSQLKVYSPDEVPENVVRGQHDDYHSIEGIDIDSETETYFFVKAVLQSKRWEGVPIYLESGKCMAEMRKEVEITFRPPISCVCEKGNLNEYQNVVTFAINDEQTISVKFWAKEPGFSYELQPEILSFSRSHEDTVETPDAYERLLFDAIEGDCTSFAQSDEIEAAWEFITPILEHWSATELYKYAKGTNGPDVKKPMRV